MEIVASLPAQLPLAEVGAAARRVETLGFDVLHVPETIHDPFTVAALAVTSTKHLTVRTSMVLAFPRSPMLTALAAWDLVKLSAGRFQLGVASQVRGNIVGRYSMPWTDPVAQLGDYICALRAIFHSFQTGEALDYDGTHYRFSRLQPYFNPGPLDHPSPPIWSGGVNPGMCRLAGRLSDGFVCHPTNSHPRVLASVLTPALREGAEDAAREDGGPRIVAGAQPIVAEDSDALAAARDARRPELAFLYSTPAYRPQLAAFGLEDLGAELAILAKRGNWVGLSEVLSDEVIDQLVPSGTFDEIPRVLQSWYSGLCHGLVLNLPPTSHRDDETADLVARCQAIPEHSPVHNA